MTNQKIQPLPTTYQGTPWSVLLLKSLPSDEVRRLIRTYGATQINLSLREVKKS
jgi:hypothetical protein